MWAQDPFILFTQITAALCKHVNLTLYIIVFINMYGGCTVIQFPPYIHSCGLWYHHSFVHFVLRVYYIVNWSTLCHGQEYHIVFLCLWCCVCDAQHHLYMSVLPCLWFVWCIICLYPLLVLCIIWPLVYRIWALFRSLHGSIWHWHFWM